MRIVGIVILFCILINACNHPVMNPKPRAYPKVEYPQRNYTAFNLDACNFSFQIPTYTQVVQNSTFFEKSPPHQCWFNIYYPQFKGNIHYSYYPINKPKSFESLKTDAFEMVDWHNKKANFIEERAIRLPNGISGYAFNIEGPAASPFQFYLTDSTHHFLRGALYFETAVNPDSIAPVLAFVRDDIIKMIDTFHWK